MTLEVDLLRIGDFKVGSLAIDNGCTLVVKCDETGRREYMYVEKTYQNLTLNDCMEYFCPETPKNINELHSILLNAFYETFAGNRNDEVRIILSNSVRLLESYMS